MTPELQAQLAQIVGEILLAVLAAVYLRIKSSIAQSEGIKADAARATRWLAEHQAVDLIALRAARAVEQVMQSASGQEKKQAAIKVAMRDLRDHGIEVDPIVISRLDDAIEAQIMAGLKAAETIMTTAITTPVAVTTDQPITVATEIVPGPATPAAETPALPRPLSAPEAEPVPLRDTTDDDSALPAKMGDAAHTREA